MLGALVAMLGTVALRETLELELAQTPAAVSTHSQTRTL